MFRNIASHNCSSHHHPCNKCQDILILCFCVVDSQNTKELLSCFSPKKDLPEKNLQTQMETQSSVKEKGQDNETFEGYTSCPPDVPVLHNDGVLLQVPPHVFSAHTFTSTLSGTVCTVDEEAQAIDPVVTSPVALDSSLQSPLSHGTANRRGVGDQVSQGIPGMTGSDFQPRTQLNQIPMPYPGFVRSYSLPAYPHHLWRRHTQSPTIIVNSGYEPTAPFYLSLLDQVVVSDIEDEIIVVRM